MAKGIKDGPAATSWRQGALWFAAGIVVALITTFAVQQLIRLGPAEPDRVAPGSTVDPPGSTNGTAAGAERNGPGAADGPSDSDSRAADVPDERPAVAEQVDRGSENAAPAGPPGDLLEAKAATRATRLDQVTPSGESGTTSSDSPVQSAELEHARNVDLQEPVAGAETQSGQGGFSVPAELLVETVTGAEADAALVDEVSGERFVLLGAEVPRATATRLAWTPRQSFEGISTPTPVLVVHGAEPGPVLCLTAAIHGDELNGIEIVRRVLYDVDAEALAGTLIGVPIVNLAGFQRSSRYLPDRRDLNRFFPGDPQGSSASRIAHSFFTQIIRKCDALVDMHTGSFHRTNLPQLRADLHVPDVVTMTKGFGATVILHSDGTSGTLRRAAVEAGIPAVTLEAGEPMRLQDDAVSHGVKGIQTLLNQLGMVRHRRLWGDPEPVYYGSMWVRADRGGILFSEVKLGEHVRKDELLGSVTNPITNVRSEIRSPARGRLLGMALNQVVMPGYAAFHIGIKAPKGKMPEAAIDAMFSESTRPTGQETEAAEGTPNSQDPASIEDVDFGDDNAIDLD